MRRSSIHLVVLSLSSLAWLLAGVHCARPAAPPLSSARTLVPFTVAPTGPAPPPQQFTTPALAETFTDPKRLAKLTAAFPAVEAFISGQADAQQLPSLALGVVVDGALALVKTVGVRDRQSRASVDADTVYRIGSITKTFTSLAILKLRDEGKLALDDPAVRILPELATVKYPTRDSPLITLRHLLTHSSGLPRLGRFNYAQADHDVTESEMLQGLTEMALTFVPGTRASYSNFGVALLGPVVTRVSGLRYRDYVNRAILAPLGMTATRWSQNDVPPEKIATAYRRGPDGPQAVAHWRLGESEAAGGLYSSLRDMARYAAFQLAAYPPRSDDDGGPLRRSSVREAHSVQRMTGLSVKRQGDDKNGQPLFDGTASGIGLAWHGHTSCDFEQVVGHAGGTEGFASLVQLLPQRGIAVVALSNDQDAALDVIVDGVLEILHRSGGLGRRQPTASPALARAMERLAALYAGFTELAYAELFTPQFREGVPFARAAEVVTHLKQIHGDCPGRPLPSRIDSPTAGAFSVACTRGRLDYRLETNPAGKITVASVDSQDLPPAPALLESARRLAALISAWSETTYADLLAPAFPRPAMQTFFRDLGARHGTCAVGKALEGDGQSAAVLALSCARGGDLRLELNTNPAGTRAITMHIAPLPPGTLRDRCPGPDGPAP